MFLRIVPVLLVAALISGIVSASLEQKPDYSESPEALETVLNLRIIDSVLATLLETEDSMELPSGWFDLDELVKQAPRLYREHLPRKDGWNENYLCLLLKENLIVLSKGKNGKHEFLSGVETMEDIKREFEGEPEFGDDMALAVGEGGEIINQPKVKLGVSKRAMADMRSIATAVESFAIDNNVYPDQGGGLARMDVLQGMVQPLYIKVLPLLDPWGEPFVYWSDGSQYILVSSGADRLFDRSYPLGFDPADGDGYLGATRNRDSDLVFVNGQFVQWHQK